MGPCRFPSPRTPCCWAGAWAPPRRAGTWPWPSPSPSVSAAGPISRSPCSTTPSPGSRGGRHLRHRLRARPARTHAAVGRRPGGGARLLRCRRADPPILARPALHRHGPRRAFLRHRPAGGGDRRPPPRPRSGVDDGTDRRHRRRRPHPQHPRAHRAGARRRRRRPATAGAVPAAGRPGGHAGLRDRLGVPARGPSPSRRRRRRRIGSRAAEATARFRAFGDRRGERALQSARKAGAVTMPS